VFKYQSTNVTGLCVVTVIAFLAYQGGAVGEELCVSQSLVAAGTEETVLVVVLILVRHVLYRGKYT